MSGIEQVDFLLARLDDDLWHERGVVAGFEKRLDAVGLRADTVNESDVRAVGERVNVVAALVGFVFGGGISRGEEDAVGAFYRNELLADDEGGGAIGSKVIVEF